jgi:PTS system galactitol-specific IIB component
VPKQKNNPTFATFDPKLVREGIFKEAHLIQRKKILIVCGTAIATSTVVAVKTEELLKREGIQADIRRCMTSESKTASKGVHLIIATTQVPDVDVPVLSGIPYLTGIGVAKLEQDILQALKDTPQ